MKLKRGDTVKLLPAWATETVESPIWGGVHGYHLGHVIQVLTGSHDPATHRAVVEWGPGRKHEFPEAVLELATVDEQKAAMMFRDGKLPEDDVMVLIRTTQGHFAVNVVEAAPFGPKEGCVAGTTKTILREPMLPDFTVLTEMLSSPDYMDTKCGTIYNAVQHIHNLWGLPPPVSVPFPLREFATIKEAVATAPATHKHPAVLYFQLPYTLAELAVNPSLASVK